MTHLVKKRYTREKHMTTKRRQPQIVIGVLFELSDDVIVNFDLSAIASAAESVWYTTLAVIQVGDYYQWIGVPHQRTSSLMQAQRTELSEVRGDDRITDL